MSAQAWEKHISEQFRPRPLAQPGSSSGRKVIIITGSASGFGKATAEKLVARGHVVYGADIDVQGNSYLDEIGGTAISMDVRKYEQVQAGVKKVLEEQGRIDVLINNAGYGEFATIENIDMDDLHNQFDVNVFGYARLQQAVLPAMRKQKSGRVIIVSSVVGKFSMPVLGWYAATKHAVEAMADALRQEVAQFNIDVVKVQPGAVNTKFGETAYERMVAGFKVGLDATFANAGGPQGTAAVIVGAVETEKPEMTYVTTSNGKGMIDQRNRLTEVEFYKMLSL